MHRGILRSRRCMTITRVIIIVSIVALVYTQWNMFYKGQASMAPPNAVNGNLLGAAMNAAKEKRLAANSPPVIGEPKRTIFKSVSKSHADSVPSHADSVPSHADSVPNIHQGELFNRAETPSAKSPVKVNDHSPPTRREVKESADIGPREAVAPQRYYPRDVVQRVQDIQDRAYEKARTPEFKKCIKENEKKGLRYANNGRNNISDEVVTVILMPHSHNDPGWLWTFDMYHSVYTQNMFTNLVKFLQEENSEMPFQWTESVSLLKWYKQTSTKSRDTIKTAINNKNLVIDHGSWSMPDEASTTLYSLVENLIIGHTWMENEFGVKPEYSWSNDPFGHSSTIPYLLKQSGIKAMVINRIDMLLKKELRETQMLEFYWRQTSAAAATATTDDESTDMFTHILPYALYNTGESFGPDHKLAKSFDFSPPETLYSPLVDYGSGKATGDYSMMEKRARLLAEQIHLRSALFKHNVILSPIGDDFRYISYSELQGVYRNWRYLANYYKENPEYKIRLKLGTLADYFSLINEDLQKNAYPVFSGDFFPYSDNSDHKPHDASSDNKETSAIYWTGYFTTRPYLKVALRRLENLLRQTEILYSLLKLKTKITGNLKSPPTTMLSEGRETLSWLLHHDAITGTSPTDTIMDFMAKLTSTLERLEDFTVQTMKLLSSHSDQQPVADQPIGIADKNKRDLIDSTGDIVLDTSPHALILSGDDANTQEAHRKALLIGGYEDEKTITLFNSLVHEVQTVAHVKLQVPKTLTTFQLVEVATGSSVTCQLNPFLNLATGISEDYLELAFEVTIAALGLKTFKLKTESDADKSVCCHLPPIDVFVEESQVGSVTSLKSREGFKINPVVESDHEIRIKTAVNEVAVSSKDGTLQSVKPGGDGDAISIHQMFGLYNKHVGKPNPQTGISSPENGIYTFTTKNEGTPLVRTPTDLVFYIKGRVEHVIVSVTPKVLQFLRINNVEHGVSVTQQVDLTPDVGDLFTRIRSKEVMSADRFYTDSNSFTMVERIRHYPTRPLASDYYPMTSAVYVEDKVHRLTLVSGQPLGVTSLHSGEIEVMLDRQHSQHDHAGVSDNLMDNRPSILQFRLLAETVDSSQVKLPVLTSTALHYSLKMSYPVSAFSGIVAPPDTESVVVLPCDYHMINLRSLDTLPFGDAKISDEQSLALVLQRFSTINSAGGLRSRHCSKENKVTLHLPTGYRIEKTTLSLLHSRGITDPKSISLKPDSIQTYKIFHIGKG